MKKLLFGLFVLIGFVSQGQVYLPSVAGTPVNKAISPSQANSVDARSMFYDANLFLYRPYQSQAEVKSYLSLSKYRVGGFDILINVGGTLNGNGTFTGGTTETYYFKNGTADSDLTLKISTNVYDSTGIAALINARTQYYVSVAAMKAVRPVNGTLAITNGYYASGDGGSGKYYFNDTSTATQDGGSVLTPTVGSGAGRWLGVFTGEINVRSFGAHGNTQSWPNITTTSGSNIITSDTALFFSADVGKKFVLRTSSNAAYMVMGTITSYISHTSIGLSTNATSNEASAVITWGTAGDEEPIQRTINYLQSVKGGTAYAPTGGYFIDNTIYILPTVNKDFTITLKGGVDRVTQSQTAKSATTFFLTSAISGIKVNLNSADSTYLGASRQYYGLAISNIDFNQRTDFNGVNGITMFRTRSTIKDIQATNMDYAVYQPDTSAQGNSTYCDLSRFENIRINDSRKGGLRLRLADATTISNFYFEAPDTIALHGLELIECQSAVINGVLYERPSTPTFTMVANTSFISLLRCWGTQIHGVHIENSSFEDCFRFDNCYALNVQGLDSRVNGNNMFTINGVGGLRISGWQAWENRNDGTYDIRFKNTFNRNVTWDEFNTWSYPSQTRRDLLIDSIVKQGPIDYRVDKQVVSNLDDPIHNQFIQGASNTDPNTPFGTGSYAQGFQVLDNNDTSFLHQFILQNSRAYLRRKSASVFGSWNEFVTKNIPLDTLTEVVFRANQVRLVGTIGATPFQYQDTLLTGATGQAQLFQMGAVISPTQATLTNMFGVINTPIINASSTNITNYTGNVSRLDLNANYSGTIANLYNYKVLNPTISGGAITNFYGFKVDPLTGSSRYGFVSSIASGTDKYNFYADGTASNYFLGKMSIGGLPAATSAILELQSTTQGLRTTVMTATQRLAIASPVAGLVVFDTDSSAHFGYTGSTWYKMTGLSSATTVWGAITGTLSNQTDLQSALNLKLNISDTSSMLTAYRNGLNLKLNISDTSAMLVPYQTALNARTAAIALKLNISDTAAMLGAYATGLNNKLNTVNPTGTGLLTMTNGTSEVGRFGVDGSSYMTMVPATGGMTFDYVGTSPIFLFNKATTVVGLMTANTGFRSSSGIQNSSSINNSSVNTLANGTTITRSNAGSLPALIVQNASTTSTGPILQLANDDSTVFTALRSGYLGINVATPLAPIHISNATEQTRIGFDASNYFSTTVGSTGSTTLALTGTSPQFTFSQQVNFSTSAQFNGTITTSSTLANANLHVTAANTASTTTTAQQIFSGATTIAYRRSGRGSVNYSLAANNGYAGTVFGQEYLTEPGTGTNPIITTAAFMPPVVVAGAATVTRAATVLITNAGNAVTTGTNDALLVDTGSARFNGGFAHGRTAVANTAYSLLGSDYMVAYTSISATRAVTLPTASSVTGQFFIIKDESGSASVVNTITIVGTIDGAANPTAVAAAYGVYRFYSNGTAFFTW